MILSYIGAVVGAVGVGHWGIFRKERPMRDRWIPLMLSGMIIAAAFALLLWSIGKGLSSSRGPLYRGLFL